MYIFCSSHAYSDYKCLLVDDVEAALVEVLPCRFQQALVGSQSEHDSEPPCIQLQVALLKDSAAQLWPVVVKAAADVQSVNMLWSKLHHTAE